MDKVTDAIELIIANKVSYKNGIIHIEGISEDIINHISLFLKWLSWNCDLEGEFWQYCDGSAYTSEEIYNYWVVNFYNK